MPPFMVNAPIEIESALPGIEIEAEPLTVTWLPREATEVPVWNVTLAVPLKVAGPWLLSCALL